MPAGEGWFHFTDTSLSPVKYQGGRPDFLGSGLVTTHNGQPVDVTIGPLSQHGLLRGNHDLLADQEMLKRDPNWTRPPGTTWHHESADTGRMQLVKRDEHKAATHTGAIADAKSQIKCAVHPSTSVPGSAETNKQKPPPSKPASTVKPMPSMRVPGAKPITVGSRVNVVAGSAGPIVGPMIAEWALNTLGPPLNDASGGMIEGAMNFVGNMQNLVNPKAAWAAYADPWYRSKIFSSENNSSLAPAGWVSIQSSE